MSGTLGVIPTTPKKDDPAKTEQTELQIAIENMDTFEIMEKVGQALDVVEAHPRPGDTASEAVGRALDLSKWAVLGIGGNRAKAKANGKDRE